MPVALTVMLVEWFRSDEVLFGWAFALAAGAASAQILNSKQQREAKKLAIAVGGVLVGAWIIVALIFNQHFVDAAADRVAAAHELALLEQSKLEAESRAAAERDHQRHLEWQRTHPGQYGEQKHKEREAAIAANLAKSRWAHDVLVREHRTKAAANQVLRSSILKWWEKSSAGLALANVDVKFATESVSAGDAATASRLIGQGAEFLNDSSISIGNDISPDGFNSAKEALGISAMKYKEALEKMIQYMDDGRPSEGAQVESDMYDAQKYFLQAYVFTVGRFVSLGGDASSIEDLQTQTSKLKRSIDSILPVP